MLLSCNIRHEGTNLSVIDFAESSEPLPGNTCRHFAVFLEAARIENENTVIFADFGGDLSGKTME
jgi:hypothetical protein